MKLVFLDLDNKIRDEKFQDSIIRMQDKSSNVPSSIVYSVISAESLRTDRASISLTHSTQQSNNLLPV